MNALLMLILVLAIVGFVLWLVVTYVPMPEPYRRVVVVVVAIVVLIWLVRYLMTASPVALP